MEQYNVWHIEPSGDVYPVVKNIADECEAQRIADLCQDMSFAGLLPETFYVTAQIGSDADIGWHERMASNSLPNPVEYLEEVRKFTQNPTSIPRTNWGRE